MPPSMTFAIPMQMQQNDEDDINRMPLIEAQEDTLKRILADYDTTSLDQTRKPFNLGERVQYIANAGDMLVGVRERCVLIYWRLLDFDEPFDTLLLQRSREHILGLPTVDCLIAHLTADNQLIFSIASSELLERVT